MEALLDLMSRHGLALVFVNVLLTQLGAPFFVENLFNGAMLILAVGLAGYTQRRRERRIAAAAAERR